MSYKSIALSARDYFLLGWLARAAPGTASLPKGCTDAQAKRLARAGYLDRTVAHATDGAVLVRYSATGKGRASWRAYGFSDEAVIEPA